MESKRIILVMIEPPDPFGNPAARWFYVLLKGLVERGYNVTALATYGKAEEAHTALSLFPSPQYDLRCFAHPVRKGIRAKIETFQRPYSYVFSSEIRHELEAELLRGFDVLHLEVLWSGWLGLRHVKRALINVLNLYETDIALVKSINQTDKWRRKAVLRAERNLLRSFPFINTLSDRLATRIKEITPHSEVSVVPLGIDLSLYRFSRNVPTNQAPVVSLIGGFGWQPTYSAGERLINQLWSEIKCRVPNARLQIVGRKARAAFGAYANLPDVSIHEDVPDTQPYFAATNVHLYAPSRGSGMKVKVMESFAYGTPVVTTSDGVEGIPAKDGVHAGICDDNAGLIQRTVRLLRDPSLQDKQRIAAKKLLEKHCSPQVTLDGIETVYDQIINPKRNNVHAA